MADEFAEFGGYAGNQPAQEEDEFAEFGGKAGAAPQQVNVPRGTSDEGSSNKWQRSAFPILGLPRLAGSLLAGAAEGGQAIHNLPYGAARIGEQIYNTFGGSPTTAISSEMPTPTNVDFSEMFGVKDPNIIEKGMQTAISALPEIMLGGTTLPGQSLGGAAYGIGADPESPLLGGIIGASVPVGLKAGSSAASSIRSNVPKVAQYLKIDKISDSIKNMLSPSSIAAKETAGSIPYQNIMNKAGNVPIFNKSNPAEMANSEYLKTIAGNPLTTRSAATKISSENFIKNPTLENAHKLQSALGQRIRDFDLMKLKQGFLGERENNIRQMFIDTKQALLKDMSNGLNKIDPGLASSYENAANNWAINVEPWRKAALHLRSMGDLENITPKRLYTKFSNEIAKKTPISGNTKIRPAQVPSEMEPLLKNLQDALAGKKVLDTAKKVAGGLGILGGLGYGVERLKDIL